MQILYLSNRPQILNTTLQQVAQFMPWISRVTIICPSQLKAAFVAAEGQEIDFIEDEGFLQSADYNPQKDHQSLNYFLRTKAIDTNSIEDVFLMSDDDNRPIQPIPQEIFSQEEKHVAHYYYGLEHWHYHETEFDIGQQSTYAILRYLNLPAMSYASHMPQIIDKSIFLGAHRTFEKYSHKYPICEWTSYFNYGIAKYPHRFIESPYKTLCWPKLPGFWPLYTEPDGYFFENYYPELYKDKGVFSGLSEAPRLNDYNQVNVEKIRRLRLIECGRFIAPTQKNDPWRSRTISNRISYRLVHFRNKLDQLLSLKDRTNQYKILDKINRRGNP